MCENILKNIAGQVLNNNQKTDSTNHLRIGGILDQVKTSEEVEASEPFVNFITSSDHGVVHFDLLQKQEKLAIKKASCRNWQNFDVKAIAEKSVSSIDRDNS